MGEIRASLCRQRTDVSSEAVAAVTVYSGLANEEDIWRPQLGTVARLSVTWQNTP